MVPDLRLIATDLDGTLIGSVNEFPLYTSFRDRVNELRTSSSLVWAACTGRSLKSFRLFFSPMRTMGIMPDFIIIHHAYIYGLTRFGYVPHLLWNLHIRYLLWANRLHARDAIEEGLRLLTGGAMGVTKVIRRRERMAIMFDSEESSTMAAKLLEEKLKPYRHLRVFRYFMEVDIRSVPFTKGLAVSELARHLGIGPEHILTIGNGHNDISMFAKEVAHQTGCPANSEAEVMKVVHQAGGHVARGRSLTGVMEILDAYREGKVSSELPEWWQDPALTENPRPTRPSQRDRPNQAHRVSIRLFLVVVIVLIMTLASFNFLPFSDKLLTPYRWLTEKALALLMAGFYRWF